MSVIQVPHKGGLLRKDMAFSGAAGMDEVKLWIMSYSNSQVLDPESLRNKIREGKQR